MAVKWSNFNKVKPLTSLFGSFWSIIVMGILRFNTNKDLVSFWGNSSKYKATNVKLCLIFSQLEVRELASCQLLTFWPFWPCTRSSSYHTFAALLKVYFSITCRMLKGTTSSYNTCSVSAQNILLFNKIAIYSLPIKLIILTFRYLD